MSVNRYSRVTNWEARKLGYFVMAFVLMLCIAAGGVLISVSGSSRAATDGPTGTWQDAGHFCTDWFDLFPNRGTAQHPYLISNARELAGLANIANDTTRAANVRNFSGQVIKLGNDINLSAREWITISQFNGTLDGQNHEILGLVSNRAFFELVNNGTVRNLRITGANSNHAMLAGTMTTGNISNVHFNGTSAHGLISNVSGINNTISDSSISGTIRRATIGTGGIVNLVNGSAVIVISRVQVNSIIELAAQSSSEALYVGGIIGTMQRLSNVTVQDSSVRGRVFVSGTSTSGDVSVGGIVGIMHNWNVTNPSGITSLQVNRNLIVSSIENTAVNSATFRLASAAGIGAVFGSNQASITANNNAIVSPLISSSNSPRRRSSIISTMVSWESPPTTSSSGNRVITPQTLTAATGTPTTHAVTVNNTVAGTHNHTWFTTQSNYTAQMGWNFANVWTMQGSPDGFPVLQRPIFDEANRTEAPHRLILQRNAPMHGITNRPSQTFQIHEGEEFVVGTSPLFTEASFGNSQFIGWATSQANANGRIVEYHPFQNYHPDHIGNGPFVNITENRELFAVYYNPGIPAINPEPPPTIVFPDQDDDGNILDWTPGTNPGGYRLTILCTRTGNRLLVDAQYPPRNLDQLGLPPGDYYVSIEVLDQIGGWPISAPSERMPFTIAQPPGMTIVIDDQGYIRINGERAIGTDGEYINITPPTPTITINGEGYVVVNDVVTEHNVIQQDPVVTVNSDGYVVVNGIITEHNINPDPLGPVITVNADGYVVVNGVPTEHNVNQSEPVITINSDGYVVVNGTPTEYNVSQRVPTITINNEGYVVVNDVVTEHNVIQQDPIITVNSDGYVVVNGIITEHNVNPPPLTITVDEDGYLVINGIRTDINIGTIEPPYQGQEPDNNFLNGIGIALIVVGILATFMFIAFIVTLASKRKGAKQNKNST
ncbi:MAG: hypothetical protein FWE01_01175 [Firmicutes bacterium]|nr:hypothetical protein [Bacillota bacterium]